MRNGNTFNYGYGAFNRILFGERVAPNTSGGYVFANYDSNGNPGQMTYPNGTVMNIQYDLRQQVAQMNIGASQVVQNCYDFMKRRYQK